MLPPVSCPVFAERLIDAVQWYPVQIHVASPGLAGDVAVAGDGVGQPGQVRVSGNDP